MRIIGPPTAMMNDVVRVLDAAIPGRVHVRFINEMLPALWGEAVAHDLDPVPVVAQSGHETDWGQYTGNSKPWQHNTAGLKVSAPQPVADILTGMGVTNVADHTLMHHEFVSWVQGARGHVQHLCLYAGWHKHYDPATDVNPRRRFIVLKGYRLEMWEEFGNGAWNNSPGYGQTVVNLAHWLQGATT